MITPCASLHSRLGGGPQGLILCIVVLCGGPACLVGITVQDLVYQIKHVWRTGARHCYIIKAVLIHITDRESVRFSLVVTELYWRKRTPVAAEEDYWPGIHVTYDHISPPIFIDISKRYCIGRYAFRSGALGAPQKLCLAGLITII